MSGIKLDESKGYLIESRLGKLVEEYGCASYSDLCRRARADLSRSLERKIIDQITTKETLFFRDTSPFELLRHKILPDLIDRRTSRAVRPISIRIWSAGCSTGQEVYSIAIVLKELLPVAEGYSIRLLGTDISDAAVAQASYGTYNRFEIDRGLSLAQRQKYFVLDGDRWKIRDEIRIMASFEKMNLMLPFDRLGRFDIILCRNVAIYFSLEDRIRLFDRIAGALERDGYLIIGASESLTSLCPRFEPKRYLRSVFYQSR